MGYKMMNFLTLTLLTLLFLSGCTAPINDSKQPNPEKGITIFGPDEPTTSLPPAPGDPLYSHQHTPWGKHYPGW